jgi:Domain of unknown function (DUF4258)
MTAKGWEQLFLYFSLIVTANMNRKLLPYVLGLIGIVLIWKLYEFSTQEDFKIEKRKKDNPTVAPVEKQSDEINRSTSTIIYTKHARCRMDCRHIDESEVQEILKEGKINYDKSQYKNTSNPKYALEGWSHDDQHLRIVFAPKEEAVVVVTCIDLETEFECHCPGDENKN